MSTISAILKPDADGMLHVPVPPELRGQEVKIEATLEAARPNEAKLAKLRGFGALKGKIVLAPDFDEPLEDFREYME